VEQVSVKINDGGKNVVVSLSGKLLTELPLTKILTLADLKDPTPRALRLGQVSFAIQEKLGIELFWLTDELPVYIIEKFQAIHSPKDIEGIGIRTIVGTADWKQPKGFNIMINLVKQ
jgi:hypothetical protein